MGCRRTLHRIFTDTPGVFFERAGHPARLVPEPLEDPMCSAVTCRKCGKTTWAGCGRHVDQVMRGVPRSQRCEGHENEPSTGFFARLFGR